MSTKTTNETVNSRILRLKTALELGQNEFCNAAKISTATYHSIKNEGEVRPRTLRNICEALGANPEWVFKGAGEMFLEKKENKVADSLLEKAFNKLEEQLNKKEEQLDKKDKLIDRLTQIIITMGGGPGSEKVNFLKAFNTASSDELISTGLLKVA